MVLPTGRCPLRRPRLPRQLRRRPCPCPPQPSLLRLPARRRSVLCNRHHQLRRLSPLLKSRLRGPLLLKLPLNDLSSRRARVLRLDRHLRHHQCRRRRSRTIPAPGLPQTLHRDRRWLLRPPLPTWRNLGIVLPGLLRPQLRPQAPLVRSQRQSNRLPMIQSSPFSPRRRLGTPSYAI